MGTPFALSYSYWQDCEFNVSVRNVFRWKETNKANPNGRFRKSQFSTADQKCHYEHSHLSLCSVTFCLLALGLVYCGRCLMNIRWMLQFQALLLLSRHKNGKGLTLLKLCIFIPGVFILGKLPVVSCRPEVSQSYAHI